MNEQDCTLQGLLLYRTTYLKVKANYGEGFFETVAGEVMRVIEEEIDIAIADIDISDGIKHIGL